MTLGRNARARAIQLPAWNEALGLPRPWDQQWSLRIQQILAFETDLLEYPDIFEGSVVMEGLVGRARRGREGGDGDRRRARRGGRGGAVHEGRARRLPSRADPPHRGRRAHRRRPQQVPRDRALAAGRGRGRRDHDRRPGRRGGGDRVAGGVARGARRAPRWTPRSTSCAAWRPPPTTSENIMPATIAAARAGATTGEWAQALRDSFGDYRGPTGVGEASAGPEASGPELEELRDEVARVGEAIGRRIKILVGKPGLDGHSNGAEQIAVRARDVGMEVVYEGIRLTPAQIVTSALQEGVHVIGLSILSGSHRELIPGIVEGLRRGRRRRPGRRRRDHPRGRRRAAEGGRRRRGLHARRTSISRRSCATSSRSWPSATASRPAPDRQLVRRCSSPGRRLERDVHDELRNGRGGAQNGHCRNKRPLQLPADSGCLGGGDGRIDGYRLRPIRTHPGRHSARL